MAKLTREEIESTVSGYLTNFNYGDCYPQEILDLENKAEVDGYSKTELINELISILDDLEIEEYKEITLSGHSFNNEWLLESIDYEKVMDGLKTSRMEEATHEEGASTLYASTMFNLYSQYQNMDNDFDSFTDVVRIAYYLGVRDGRSIALSNMINKLEELNKLQKLYDNASDKEKLLKLHKYYNMKEICEIAEVSYKSFKNWKVDSNKYPLSEEKINKLIIAIESVKDKAIVEE